MRRLARVLGIGAALVLALAGPAPAAPFGATLGIAAGSLGGGAVFVTGSGSGTSAPLLVTLPGGVFAGSDSTAVTGNPFVTALDLQVTGNDPASFVGPPLGAAMRLRGRLLLRGRRVSTGTTMTTLIDVPLSIPSTGGYLGFGGGGTVTLASPANPSASFVVYHDPWSLEKVFVTGLPYTYTYHVPAGKAASHVLTGQVYYNGTAAYTGTDSRTPGGLGQITFVSPTKVQHRVGGSPGGIGTFVVLGTLTLSFVPEPGTLVLLGAGVVGLALAGRARQSE